MYFPKYRLRRLRRNATLRRLVRETRLAKDDLIYPLFAVPGVSVRNPVPSMPGVFQLSVDELVHEALEAKALGIPAILLFGIPEAKDEVGSGAYAQDGIVQRAVQEVKSRVSDLLVITDVCLCEYTSHGHCGVLRGGEVENDATLELLARTALSHARAGADV
ncbi:MAG: porphobilinogen synthase, partial [Nitrospirota bacterium]